jgi:propanediol dehydratase small subunit
MGLDRPADYPLGTERPELVTTPSGLRLDEVTLDALRTGRLTSDQIRATPETLRRQAEIAREVSRLPLAVNLERAAELSSVDAERHYGSLLELISMPTITPAASSCAHAGTPPDRCQPWKR